MSIYIIYLKYIWLTIYIKKKLVGYTIYINTFLDDNVYCTNISYIVNLRADSQTLQVFVASMLCLNYCCLSPSKFVVLYTIDAVFLSSSPQCLLTARPTSFLWKADFTFTEYHTYRSTWLHNTRNLTRHRPGSDLWPRD